MPGGKLKSALLAHQAFTARQAAAAKSGNAKKAKEESMKRGPKEKKRLKDAAKRRMGSQGTVTAGSTAGGPASGDISKKGTGSTGELGDSVAAKGSTSEERADKAAHSAAIDASESSADQAPSNPAGGATSAAQTVNGEASSSIPTSASTSAIGPTTRLARIDGRLPIVPFSPSDTILLLGEANFSFSLSLLSLPPAFRPLPHHILATTYDDEKTCHAKYPDAKAIIEELRAKGVRVEFGVDAGALEKCKTVGKGRWSKVVFNFPHAGEWSCLSLTSYKGSYTEACCWYIALDCRFPYGNLRPEP
jgi:hypothetical protein